MSLLGRGSKAIVTMSLNMTFFYLDGVPKYWNLTNLFHPEAWMWTFLTFILITVTLKFASVLGYKIGLTVGSEEVALIPFRLLS